MKINNTGWLNYIAAVVIACTSCQIFAFDSPHFEQNDTIPSSRRTEITHLEAFDDIKNDSVLVKQLDKISTNLFFPITCDIDKDALHKLQDNRQQLRILSENLRNKDKLQSIDWTSFHNDFIANKMLLSNDMQRSEIQSQVTHPLYANKFTDLLKRNIDVISLHDFCHYIVEFDYTLRKAFLTKPPQEGELSCERCGEQEIECTKFMGQPMLECNFCGHTRYLY